MNTATHPNVNTVTGTATFVEENAAYVGNVTPVQGAYEVTCNS